MRLGTGVFVAVCGLLSWGCGSSGEPEGEPLKADAEVILDASSTAMANVQSVRFDLERSGADVFIDQFQSLALDKIKGRFSAPGAADAVLTVTVDGNLRTELGAIAIGGDIWLSNPVTGKFEVFDTGYDIDPSTFFDPKGGWGPLMAALKDPKLIGVEDRGGKRYHVRGIAPRQQVEIITAGLAGDQDVVMDFWLRRDTGLVTAAEFETVFAGKTTSWKLGLSSYGADFDIEAPDLD